MEESVATIERPPRSPDLNPVENVWAILSNTVYSDFKQYDTIDDLEESILYEGNGFLSRCCGSFMHRWCDAVVMFSPNEVSLSSTSVDNHCVQS